MEILRFPGLGWEIPISRVAVSIGSLEIYWYGVIIAVGFGLGLWVYLSHNRSCGIHPDEGLDIILWSMLGAIVGARAYYVAFQWDHYKDNLKEIFNLRGGGLAIYGGIIGALIVAFIVCRSKKLPMLPVADAAFPGVMLGQAIGRWGNFFNMEAFGTNTTLPWGMTSDTISNYLSRHQAALLAQAVARRRGLPCAQALTREDSRAAQMTLPASGRAKNVEGCMRADECVRGKRILLIDDVYTTGSTAREAARALREAGAESVGALVAARTLAGGRGLPEFLQRSFLLAKRKGQKSAQSDREPGKL